MEQQTRIKKLIYQSAHRGCKETDLLLGDFAKKYLPHCNRAELDLYEAFIHENDWDIYAWFTGDMPLPEHYHHQLIFKCINHNVLKPVA